MEIRTIVSKINFGEIGEKLQLLNRFHVQGLGIRGRYPVKIKTCTIIKYTKKGALDKLKCFY